MIYCIICVIMGIMLNKVIYHTMRQAGGAYYCML